MEWILQRKYLYEYIFIYIIDKNYIITDINFFYPDWRKIFNTDWDQFTWSQ